MIIKILKANNEHSFLWKMNNKLNGFCYKNDPLNELNTTENQEKRKILEKLNINNFYNVNFTYIKQEEEGEEKYIKTQYNGNKCRDMNFLINRCKQFPIQ